MGFMKRKKQPHLFRDAAVDPTVETLRASAQARVNARKKPSKRK